MSEIKYVKGDIFKDLSENVIIIHSANCQGVMGRGFASELKARFPDAYSDYRRACLEEVPKFLVGKFRGYQTRDCYVVSLFTSLGFGSRRDPPGKISSNTQDALNYLISSIPPITLKTLQFRMPRINSGLFNVPWSITEDIIYKTLISANCEVLVYEL